jgi:Low-density lipoprotein receptor domain class A
VVQFAVDEHCTPPEHFKCSDGKCIPKSYLCDGESDCLDKSDEERQDCEVECNPSDFLCLNKKCIAKNYYCDGDNDCGDNSDEPNGCSSVTSVCESNEFACANEQCIALDLVCDGKKDCYDGSDENDHTCSK